MPLYEQVLAQLASFNLTEAEGERVRAEEGETSSHFFLRLEKKRGTESWISAMRVSNGVAVTDVEGICESWASFYQDLFTDCPVDLGVQPDLLDCLSLSLSVDDVVLVTVQSRLMRLMLLSLAWLRASLQALMVCQWNFMLLSEIYLVRILLMFSMLLWRLTSFLSLSVSFLVWLECVFLGRLCWLYWGLLGSVFFVVFLLFFFFCFSVCVFPLFAPPRSPSLAVLRFSWALSWLCLSVFPSCLLYIAFYTVYSL